MYVCMYVCMYVLRFVFHSNPEFLRTLFGVRPPLFTGSHTVSQESNSQSAAIRSSERADRCVRVGRFLFCLLEKNSSSREHESADSQSHCLPSPPLLALCVLYRIEHTSLSYQIGFPILYRHALPV